MMKNQLKSVELFLTIGLVTAIGVSSSPSVDAVETEETLDEQTSEINYLLAAGGEGGGNPDVDYLTVLGLMKGHLIVAQELLAEGDHEGALPHIGHPVEELYSDIETELPERNVDDFKPTLNQLNDLAKSAPDSPQIDTLFTETLNSIDQAIAALPEEQLQSPEFVLDVIVELLKNAAAEYEASIANNQIVEAEEYQDSRGFVLYSEELYQTVADQVSQERPDDHQVITDSFTELKTAWPSVNPPEVPVKSPAEVNSLVSQIELHK